MKIKGLIFDLDGTLLDSMDCWENIDRSFLIENDIVPPNGISDIVKKMSIQSSAMYFKTQFSLKLSCQEIIDRIEEMVTDQYFNTIPLKNGAYELVHNFKKAGYIMCIATATYNRLADAALKRLGIYECFEFVLTSTDIGSSKEKPDIYLKAAEKMNCSINDSLVVEDSLHCIETAANAGFHTIAVYDKTADREWDEISAKAWRSVKNLNEIADIFRKECI